MIDAVVLSDPSFALTESQLRSAAHFVNQNLQQRTYDDNVLRCCEKLVAIEGVGMKGEGEW